MSKIKCQLFSHSNGPHLQQTYAGFLMLQRRGLIDLEQRVSAARAVIPTRTEHLRDARKAHLKVVVNSELTLHYDAHDSWEIDEEFLAGADYYFKRSFSEAHAQQLEAREKIYPLGLYYNVYPSGVDWRGFKRSLAFIDRKNWRRAARPFDPLNWLGFTPRVHLMESLPNPHVEPKVLFMARAWDPYDAADRTDQKVQERTQINDVRADCIRALRRAFGERFYGGFMHRKHALEHYPDALMPDPKAATKGSYIKLLQYYPICLATTGLHGSIGGKLAEYVAFSKAIVTEKLNHEVPGAFLEEQNYLTFSSSEQCVAQVQRLFEGAALEA